MHKNAFQFQHTQDKWFVHVKQNRHISFVCKFVYFQLIRPTCKYDEQKKLHSRNTMKNEKVESILLERPTTMLILEFAHSIVHVQAIGIDRN